MCLFTVYCWYADLRDGNFDEYCITSQYKSNEGLMKSVQLHGYIFFSYMKNK